MNDKKKAYLYRKSLEDRLVALKVIHYLLEETPVTSSDEVKMRAMELTILQGITKELSEVLKDFDKIDTQDSQED